MAMAAVEATSTGQVMAAEVGAARSAVAVAEVLGSVLLAVRWGSDREIAWEEERYTNPYKGPA